MKETTVGLFGTCGNSKWREKFISTYESQTINYFNPDAGDNWHPGMIATENEHLQEDDIILFPVLAETLGLGSLGEIGFSVLNSFRNVNNGSGQYLVVLIEDDCNDAKATEAERNHSIKTRKLVKSKLVDVKHPNIFVVNDLEDMLSVSIQLVDIIFRQKVLHAMC
jgi:hypothetical protein